MLSSSNRLPTLLFKEIIQKGSIFHSDFFILRCLDLPSGNSRFGISVPKKIEKTAVARNKLKRRIYSIIRNIKNRFVSKKNIVLILKNGSGEASFESLRKNLEKLFVKCGLLK